MNKWFRRALLGGVAMSVMATGAYADQSDDLEALKAQLEALQARVATIESRGSALPEGVSLITFERGQHAGLLKDELFDEHELERAPDSRGMTIAITPTADLPAPVASIELSGYIRSRLLWIDTDATKPNFELRARGQIDIAATVDTAVGRVTGGIQLRGDFTGNSAPNSGNGLGVASNTNVVMRTAWATWQMTDALSMTFGHTGQIASLSNVSSTLAAVGLDPYGPTNTRSSQVRFTYKSGPFDLRFGIEQPNQDGRNRAMPEVAGSLGFDMGVVGFRLGGQMAPVSSVTPGATGKTGFALNAGIDMDLGTMATFNVGGVYTKALGCDGLLASAPYAGINVDCLNNAGGKVKAWGAVGNLNINLTPTVIFATSLGYYNATNDGTVDGTLAVDKGYSVGGALVWKPVDALQFGVAGGYYKDNLVGGGNRKNLTVGLAGWFFF